VILEAVRRGHIRRYARLRDDGIVCVPKHTTANLFQQTQKQLTLNTNGLELEIAPLRADEAVWLDLTITRGLGNKLNFRTHIKETKSGLYLNASSNLPARALRNWCNGECARYARSCSRAKHMLPLVERLHASVSVPQMIRQPEMLHERRVDLFVGRNKMHREMCPFALPFHRVRERLGIPTSPHFGRAYADCICQ